MNLETATVLFAAIIAALIALPASPPAAPREVVVAHLPSVQSDDGCAQQTWPHFSAACLRYANGGQGVERVRPVAVSR